MTESVSLYRDLAMIEPDAHRSRLAEAVSDLAALSEGPHGLALAEEAVALRRAVVAGDRPVEVPGLALSLSNLATKQTEAGLLDPALATGEEALRVMREAVAANRAAAVPRYAFLLREQARRLDQAGAGRQ
jgi:hypothetical protein